MVTPCDFEGPAGERREEEGEGWTVRESLLSRMWWPMIREIDLPRGVDFMAGSVYGGIPPNEINETRGNPDFSLRSPCRSEDLGVAFARGWHVASARGNALSATVPFIFTRRLGHILRRFLYGSYKKKKRKKIRRSEGGRRGGGVTKVRNARAAVPIGWLVVPIKRASTRSFSCEDGVWTRRETFYCIFFSHLQDSARPATFRNAPASTFPISLSKNRTRYLRIIVIVADWNFYVIYIYVYIEMINSLETAILFGNDYDYDLVLHTCNVYMWI